MQIWELKVHEILYIESVGVLIMFPDELLSYLKLQKKHIERYYKDHSAASSKQ